MTQHLTGESLLCELTTRKAWLALWGRHFEYISWNFIFSFRFTKVSSHLSTRNEWTLDEVIALQGHHNERWWRFKSPAYRLFVPTFVQMEFKQDIKAPRHWPLWGESAGDRWFPSQRANNTANVWRRHHGMHGFLFCANSLSEPIMAQFSTNVSLDFDVFTIDDNEKVYRNLLSIIQATVLHIEKYIFMITWQSAQCEFPSFGKKMYKHPSMGLLLW